MIIAEVKNPVVETRTIKGKNGDFELHQLTVWATLDPDGYPEKVVLQVENGEVFKPGKYLVMPQTFQVGSYNRLEASRVKLRAITPDEIITINKFLKPF